MPSNTHFKTLSPREATGCVILWVFRFWKYSLCCQKYNIWKFRFSRQSELLRYSKTDENMHQQTTLTGQKKKRLNNLNYKPPKQSQSITNQSDWVTKICNKKKNISNLQQRILSGWLIKRFKTAVRSCQLARIFKWKNQ